MQLVKNGFICFGNQSTKPQDRADIHLRKLRSVTWTSLGQEDPLEEEMATSQFSSLENPTVRDWQAIVHRVTMSETIWARTHTYTHTLGYMLHRWLLLSLYREISILSVTLLTFKEFLYLGSIDLVIFHSSNWRVLFYVCVCVFWALFQYVIQKKSAL